LERGRCPVPNLSSYLKKQCRSSSPVGSVKQVAGRRIRLGAPLRSSSMLIALIKLLLRLRSHHG